MTDSLPLRAHKLSFSYIEAEDRLVLSADGRGGERVTLLITRRLTARLLNALASLLERSNPRARQAPSPLRGDVVLLEHQAAIQAPSQTTLAPSGPVPGAPPRHLVPPALLTAVDVRNRASHFSLAFRDARQPLVTCDLTRVELHRVVQLMLTKVTEAGWCISVDASWLGLEQQSVTIN
jgi:hypothetical protein